MAIVRSPRRANLRRRRLGGVRKYKKRYAKPRAMAVAQAALQAVKKLEKTTVAYKWFAKATNQDLAVNAMADKNSGEAFRCELTNTNGFSAIWNTGGLHGNGAFLNYMKGTYEIHHDNIQSEEETCNYTVMIWRPKKNMDQIWFQDGDLNAQCIYRDQPGQVYLNPQLCHVLYRKHFTLTMGGTSPGTAGESRRYGKFYVPYNKYIRFRNQIGTGGDKTDVYPATLQDRVFFSIWTDNTGADLEYPRLNFSALQKWKDSDVNDD